MQAKASSSKRFPHRREILFITISVVLVASIALGFTLRPKQGADSVRVSHHGRYLTSLRLDKEDTFEFHSDHGTIRIEVKGGKAGIVASPCPGQHCVHEGFKGDLGASIICAPEEVALVFVGEEAVEEIDL